MIVSDIKADAEYVLGQCDQGLLYRRLTEAVKLLGNSGSGLWDGLVGSMTICVDDLNGCITLPRDVLTPLQLNQDGCVTFPRDKWFEYHINGPGSTKYQSNGVWDDQGEFPTFREIVTPQPILIQSENEDDDGKSVTINFLDENDREQRVTVTLDFFTSPDTGLNVKRILTISKAVTLSPVRLLTTVGDPLLIGWYYGNETNPMYRRIKVKAKRVIQMIYRRRDNEITSDLDYIPLANKMAVIQALRSIKYRYENNLAMALDAEQDAFRLLDAEQNVRNINNSPVSPQIQDFSTKFEARLWSGSRGYSRGRLR